MTSRRYRRRVGCRLLYSTYYIIKIVKSRSYLKRFAWLSIAAAVITIALKAAAYFLTGSVGLLSDAAESAVNLTAALIAFTAISIADRPPDESHTFGHDKAEYFSSGAEGTLILVAAAGNTGPDPMSIGVPGNVPYVLTVGAMSDNYTPADGSDDTLTFGQKHQRVDI